MNRRYKELYSGRKIQNIEQDAGKGRAIKGKAKAKSEAGELYTLLRNYTYTVIGAENAFRRVARDFSGLDGSNWRNNRTPRNWKVRVLSRVLYSTQPSNIARILRVESCLEEIYRRSTGKRSNNWKRSDQRRLDEQAKHK